LTLISVFASIGLYERYEMSEEKPKKKYTKRIQPDFSTESLVSVAEAAGVFFDKMSEEDRKDFGDDEIEQRTNYEKYLRGSTASTFGVVAVSLAAELLRVKKVTLQAATGPAKRDKYYPNALIFERDPITNQELWPEGRKWVCIFHKEFVDWMRDKYNPRHRPPTGECELNTLLKDEAGNWLPKDKWPTYSYESGKDSLGKPVFQQATLELCPNIPLRRRSKCCTGNYHGIAHHVLLRMLNGSYHNMAFQASMNRSAVGVRQRTLQGKLNKLREAKQKNKPVRRERPVYLPDGYFK
jgi:hypothetical protein